MPVDKEVEPEEIPSAQDLEQEEVTYFPYRVRERFVTALITFADKWQARYPRLFGNRDMRAIFEHLVSVYARKDDHDRRQR